MENIEQLNVALLKVQREVPFNNFCRYLAAEKLDKDLPVTLGGACVYQLRKLAKELTSVEGEESYVEEKGGLHTALIKRVPETGDRHYLDPFLLHKEAINLDEILRTKRPKALNVYPQLLTERQATLELRPSGMQRFYSTLHYNPYNEDEYVSFLFDLDAATSKHPPLTKKRLSGSRPPEFVLRLFNEDLSTTTVGWDLAAKSFKIKRKGGRLTQRTYLESSKEFESEKEIVCARIGVNWSDFQKVIQTAWEICRALPEEERRVF